MFPGLATFNVLPRFDTPSTIDATMLIIPSELPLLMLRIQWSPVQPTSNPHPLTKIPRAWMCKFLSNSKWQDRLPILNVVSYAVGNVFLRGVLPWLEQVPVVNTTLLTSLLFSILIAQQHMLVFPLSNNSTASLSEEVKAWGRRVPPQYQNSIGKHDPWPSLLCCFLL